MQKRKVILHYHLFKNAGTSLDASLKDNFSGEEWDTKEFPASKELNEKLQREWISNNEVAKCFSSHTAELPPPQLDDIDVLPIIFVRHPLDRIASAYAFEKKQGGNTFGAILAKNTDFKGYIEVRLAIGQDRQCRNFHTHRLGKMFSPGIGSELERAIKATDTLPFVGVVENYSDSLVRLEAWLRDEGFTDIDLKAVEKNVSRNRSKTIEEKLSEMREELGADCFTQLLEANSDDLELYNHVVEAAQALDDNEL